MKIAFSPPFIDEDVKQEVLAALDSGWITTGPKVKELEAEVAGLCNVKAALGVNSATSGMMLVLHWLGVKRGDEVIIPAYTYCATALAVMHMGATPVMVDVREDFTIDVTKVRAAINNKTKAILTVDFGGWPCDYDSIYNLLEDGDIQEQFVATSEVQQRLGRILVFSDAAHALGATYKGKAVGSVADVTVFSFHAVKNLTTAEGGMICLNMPAPFDNVAIYTTLRLWSLNGQTKDAFTKTVSSSWKYDIVYAGFKINLPDVLAAIGLAQFRKYKGDLLKERKRVFDFYNTAFSQYDWAICPPFNDSDSETSYHLYPLRIKGISEAQRDAIIDTIMATDVMVNVHFRPLPMLTLFIEKGFRIEDFPLSYLLFSTEISLPVYPQLTTEACAQVVAAVVKAVGIHSHV